MFEILFAGLLATSADDGLLRAPLPGFKIGFQQSVGGASILEEVPIGETVDHWTRMVTTQRFRGAADRIDAAGFLTLLARSTQRACVDARSSQVGVADGSAEVRLDCPLNSQTGLPESFIAKAMPRGHDLQIVQVAWRRIPGATDIAWGERYLQGVSVKPGD